MFDEGFIFMKTFATYFRCKLIFSGVFGHMVFQSVWALKQFTAVVARVPSAIVSSDMIFYFSWRNLDDTDHRSMNTGLCDVGYGLSGPARKWMFYHICYTGDLCHRVQPG